MTHQNTVEPTSSAHQLSQSFSSTQRGARLARLRAVRQFTDWTGLPHDCDTAQTVALVTAELAANAVTHGSLPGHDFLLTMALLPGAFRIEVTDTRPERPCPPPGAVLAPAPEATSGRGLLLVAASAQRWGSSIRDAYTKTVWAEVVRPS